MIKKIDQIYHWIETVITAILGILSGYLIYEIQLEKSQKWFMVIIAVILIVLSEKILHMIFRKIINSSTKLRKLILREHFIEGQWLGKVINTGDTADVYGYSVVNIMHSDIGYEVNGKVFDIKSNSFTGGFGSSDSHYYGDEKIFTYYFTGFNLYDGSANDIIGKTTLKVVQSELYPTEFMGSIFDTKNKNELNMSLTKVSENMIGQHDINTKKGLKAIIEEL